MPKSARMGDAVYGYCNGDITHPPMNVTGTITSGMPNILVENKPIATKSSTVLLSCGHAGIIDESSLITKANGIGIVRVGDKGHSVMGGVFAVSTGAAKTDSA